MCEGIMSEAMGQFKRINAMHYIQRYPLPPNKVVSSYASTDKDFALQEQQILQQKDKIEEEKRQLLKYKEMIEKVRKAQNPAPKKE